MGGGLSHRTMGVLRRFEFRAGTAGPWVVLNPSLVVPGVAIDSMVFDGTFGDEVTIVFFKAPIRSTFLQRLALARHLTFDNADRRLVWLRQHQMRTGVERLQVGFVVRSPVAAGQALFVAVVDASVDFDLELFGEFLK